MGKLEVGVIHNIREFALIRDEWNKLLEQSDSNTVFLRWEWLYNWWLVYGNNSYRLFIVVVRDKGRLVGIAPFYIKRNWGWVREINFLGSNIVCSDYLDFISLKKKEEIVLSSICSSLKQHKKAWDVLQLSDMPSISSSIDFIESFFLKYRKVINKEYTVCPYIKFNMPWDDIYNSYASILKNTIKRKIKRFEKNSDSGFVEIKHGEGLESFFSEFLRLNKLSLRKRGISSPFLEDDFLIFHKKIIRKLLKEERVKFYFLKKDGQYIAGIYILLGESKYYYYQSGFDPAYEKDSPGTLLFHYCIKAAYENGAKEFDFLQGNESYKSNWTKHKRFNVKIVIYNHSIKGMQAAFVNHLTTITKERCKKLYDQLMRRRK